MKTTKHMAAIMAIVAGLSCSSISAAQQDGSLTKDAKGKAEAAALQADLLARKVAPQNIKQAAIAYGAKNGIDLAGSPMLRPDRQLYYMYGYIEQAEDSSLVFLARSSRGEENDALAKALRAPSVATNYYAVEIPKHLEDYFFSNAKINAGFEMVGEYAWNSAYTTVSGQKKSMPGFDVKYFQFWHASPAPQVMPEPPAVTATREFNATRETDSHDQAFSKIHQECFSAAITMDEKYTCIEAEMIKQDRRLNTAYKKAMAIAENSASLRAAQRQWMKYRDKHCALDEEANQGQSAPFIAAQCNLTVTAIRADELEILS